jgi:hypothetical protein
MTAKTKTLIVAATLALAAPAVAQVPPSTQMPPCGPRVSILEQLERDFAETPVSRGLASNGTVLELLVSASGTWTMLISLPNGSSCFGAAGEMWETAPGGLSAIGKPAKFTIAQ